MRGNSLFGTLSGGPPATDGRQHEQGYLLVFSGVMIIVLVAMLSSYSFVLKRDNSYKANFAAGQRFAELASAAHYYAQQVVYDNASSVTGNCNLVTDMNLPGGAALPALVGTTMTVEICGADAAPVHTIVNANVKAASAYAVLRIRSNADRAPSDTIAFLAGAASNGMDRVGIYGTNAGGDCDGVVNGAVMSWGPDQSACLTNGLITSLGINVGTLLPGDVIVPVWETALSQNDTRLIYRHKQPERPDTNTMMTDLSFDNSALPAGPVVCGDLNTHCLQNVADLDTQNLNVAVIGAADTLTNFQDGLVARAGTTTNLQQADMLGSVNVYDQNGAATVMNVAGLVDLSADGTPNTISVSDTINATGVDVIAANPIQTNLIGAQVGDPRPPRTDISLIGVNPKAVFDDINPVTTIENVTINNATGRFNVLGSIGAAGGTQTFTNIPGSPMDIYAASINVVNPTSRIVSSSNWSVGSIDQFGNTPTNNLTVDDFRVNQDCIGRACPNAVNQAPGGGF